MPLNALDELNINAIVRGVTQEAGNNFSDDVSSLIELGIREEVAIKFVMGELIVLAQVDPVIDQRNIPDRVGPIFSSTYGIGRNIYRNDALSHLSIKSASATKDDVWNYFRVLLDEDLAVLKQRLEALQPETLPYSDDEKKMLEFVKLDLGRAVSKWATNSPPATFLEYCQSPSANYPNILSAAHFLGCELDHFENFHDEVKQIYAGEVGQYEDQMVKSLLIRILSGQNNENINVEAVPQKYHKLLNAYNKINDANGFESLFQKVGEIVNTISVTPPVPVKYDEEMEGFLRSIDLPIDIIPLAFADQNLDGFKFLIKDKTGINQDYFNKILMSQNFVLAQEILNNANHINIDDHIHLIAREGQVGAVDFLVRNGANINAFDENGLSVFHVSAQAGNIEIMKYLLKSENFDRDILTRDPNPLGLTLDKKLGEKSKATTEFLLKIPEIKDTQLGESILEKKAAHEKVNEEVLRKMGHQLSEWKTILSVARAGGCTVISSLRDDCVRLNDRIFRMKYQKWEYESLFEEAAPPVKVIDEILESPSNVTRPQNNLQPIDRGGCIIL